VTFRTIRELDPCLPKGIGAIEHGICWAPSNIAVERDLEWLGDTTFDLQPFKGLDALARWLDLKDVSK
jgi:hypothetical protein